MLRPDLKKETIEKIGRGYRFFKILSEADGTKLASDHIKDYFQQFFKDAMSDILHEDGNLKKLQEIEALLGDKFVRNDAILREMEILAGVQMMFLHYLEGNLAQEIIDQLRESIAAIEIEIHNDIVHIPDKKIAEYARRQADNLFALEDLVMQDVARSFREQGMEGMVIGIGLHGGLKRFDI